MASEETPLLNAVIEHEDVYKRFSPQQKRVVVSVVSWIGLIPLFLVLSCRLYLKSPRSFILVGPLSRKSPTSIVPSIQFKPKSFFSLAVSLSMLSGAVSSLLWATYSGFYGRRPIFLVSMPCLCLGSLGVALSGSIPSLMTWRVFQAFGASSGLSVGAAVIGDIYKLEERGTAMGLFFGATLFGAAIAPLAGGIATHYGSWRYMQYVLFLAGSLAFISSMLYLPETSHPGSRGVDKLCEEGSESQWVWLNPFKSVALLRSPNLLAVSLAATCVLLTDFVLLIPLSYTIGARYHITNEALIGAFFIAAGLGNIMGAPIAGRMSDKIVVKWRELRGGEWVPEDRLRATVLPAAILVPFSILLSGLTTQFIEGRLGIVLNLFCLFMNGIGVDLVLSPIAS
ncbi:hypothetical protein AcV5_005547 [Taiwanofungus camphoratus]|nr:hypothetical protein AcV5_005547 [Antrodia cinnamomea]